MGKEQLSVADALSRMRMGVDYRFTISCRELFLEVRPLSLGEMTRVTNHVAALIKKAPEDERTALMQSSLLAKEILKRANTESPERTDRVLSDPLLDAMTADELQHLYTQYRDHCETVNPSIESMTQTQLDELVAAAKKNDTSRLTTLSRHQLRQLVGVLLTSLTSPKDNASGGSPET